MNRYILQTLAIVGALSALTTLSACEDLTPQSGDAPTSQPSGKPGGGSETLCKPIVDGTVAAQGDMRSTVAIVDRGTSSYFCTGTLIAPRVVLSAAHCFEETSAENVSVGVGTLDGASIPASKQVAVERIVMHEEYLKGATSADSTGIGQDHDIALVLLSQPVSGMVPTPILPLGDLDAAVRPGTQLVVSGFGIYDLASGRDGELRLGVVPFERRTDHEFIAGDRGGRTDTCNGDSGGPVYYEAGGSRYLVGVTSRAVNDAQMACGDSGIYTLASAYETWIRDASQGMVDGSTTAPAVTPGGATVDACGQGDNAGATQPATPEPPAAGNDDSASDDQLWDDSQDQGDDICESEGWYNDGYCDEDCARPDADCDF